MVSTYFTDKIHLLAIGGLQGCMLVLALRQRGIFFPWLLLAVTGMVIAMQMLKLCVLYQVKAIRPWDRAR